jgi:hypothetical protein
MSFGLQKKEPTFRVAPMLILVIINLFAVSS